MAKKEKDKDKDEESVDKDAPHRQIPPEATNRAMWEWLVNLFKVSDRENAPVDGDGDVQPKSTPDAFPDRVVLKPVYDRGGMRLGTALGEWPYKPRTQRPPNHEDLAELANEIVRIAQHHCNHTRERGRQRYMLYAYSNLRSADAYATFPFQLVPTFQEYADGEAPASDDDDSHRDRLLAQSLSHNRWGQEQMAEERRELRVAYAGIMSLQREIIEDQRVEMRSMAQERRQMILDREAMLDRQSERKLKEDEAKLKMEALRGGMDFLLGTIGPMLQIYFSKGQFGIAEGLRKFIDSLEPEVQKEIMGQYAENGDVIYQGILEREQVRLLVAILEGTEDAKRLPELVTSLRADQFGKLQHALPPAKQQQLMGLAKAAADVVAKDTEKS